MPASVPPDTPNYVRDADDLTVLSCRRTTLEWVLRRCALAESNVEFATGRSVQGLTAERGGDGPLPVTGVRLDDGEAMAADVVVAATGRRDAVPAWFAEHGLAIAEDEHPTGTIYLSRFYRADDPPLEPIGYQGGRRAGLGFVVAGADHDTYSATLAVDTDDAELRAHLLDADRFEAVLPLFREMEPVVTRGGTPLTDVQAMGGLINRIRRFTDDRGEPLATGFFAIGDAHTCTNPLYGRGSSLAVLQAVLVADALAANPDDSTAAGRDYEAASKARVEPWYDVSVLTDGAARRTESTDRTERSDRSEGPRAPKLDLGTLRRIAGSGDPELTVLVTKFMTLLLTPQELFGDPLVLERVTAAATTPMPRERRPDRGPRLTREAILAAGR